MELPQLGSAHRALLALVGTWQGTEELAASPWAAATTAAAVSTYRMALNGFAVVQDYRQSRVDGQTFLMHGVFTADSLSGETLWYAFDSYGYPPDGPARGRWDGHTLKLLKVTPRGVARHDLTVQGDRLSHNIDLQLAPAPEFTPFMRAVYRREG